MIKVYKLKDSEGYILMTEKNSIFSSTLSKLISIMYEIGIDAEEIEYGLSELEINGHDVAEYGIGIQVPGLPRGPKFLFSKKVA